ncbi:olfactory receptor 6N2-like [Maylandia zebra]|uniref:olfactory receptor 6N2-like n=1 Tax=Maylandia zebra TaxID=106582 RepID=UPI00403C6665
MDVELNLTLVTFGGFAELHKYRYLYFVVISTLYILILCFNSTIVFLIWTHKNLHEPMYIFIAALLINSVLYSMIIYPKLLSDVLSEKQTISYPLCLFQGFLYYTSGGSEFLLLAAMAYDRYVSICKPLQYPVIMNRITIYVCLILAWLIPAFETSVLGVLYSNVKLCSFTLTGIFCNNSLYKLQCVPSVAISIYGMVTLINIALLPLLFILFTYIRIIRISYHCCREVRKKAVKTCLPHLLVLINFSCFIFLDIIIVRLDSDLSKTIRLTLTFQSILFHPLLNPIIYGLKMNEIFKHIKILLSNKTNQEAGHAEGSGGNRAGPEVSCDASGGNELSQEAGHDTSDGNKLSQEAGLDGHDAQLETRKAAGRGEAEQDELELMTVWHPQDQTRQDQTLKLDQAKARL